jgi:WD40 repeat protein
VQARAVSADGGRLWSVEEGGRFKEWDLRPARPLTIPFDMRDLLIAGDSALSPDGGRLATLKTDWGKEFSPAVQVWEVATGKKTSLLPPRPRDLGTSPRLGVAISRDGRRAALARADGLPPRGGGEGPRPADLTVWEVATGKALFYQELQAAQVAAEVALSPDGTSIAVALLPEGIEALAVTVFDVDTHRPRVTLTAPGGALQGLLFSPDGRRLAIAARPVEVGAAGTLSVWDLATGARLSAVPLRGAPLVDLAWSPDGSRLAVPGSGAPPGLITVLDALTGKPLAALEEPLSGGPSGFAAHGVAFSPDGRRVAGYLSAAAPGVEPLVKVWDAASGKDLLTFRPGTGGDPLMRLREGRKGLAFTADGHRLVSCATSSTRARPLNEHRLVVTTWDATPRAGAAPR